MYENVNEWMMNDVNDLKLFLKNMWMNDLKLFLKKYEWKCKIIWMMMNEWYKIINENMKS